jgi:hypothetical protein
MATITLTGQATLAAGISPKLLQLKNALIARKPIWDKLPPEKRLAWAKGTKDPIMVLARDTYLFLDAIFEDTK